VLRKKTSMAKVWLPQNVPELFANLPPRFGLNFAHDRAAAL
jgi:hypothetical protein